MCPDEIQWSVEQLYYLSEKCEVSVIDVTVS